MFAFTSGVSNGDDTDGIARTARRFLANILGGASGAAPMTDVAAAPAGRFEATVPNLSAATGYMAWRS